MNVTSRDFINLLGFLMLFSVVGCRGEEAPRPPSNTRSVKFIELGGEDNLPEVGQHSHDVIPTDQKAFSNLYKTPSGKKYHTTNCYLVTNVSLKLDGRDDILKYGLSPCKRCKPPTISSVRGFYSSANKAVGESALVRCKGKTKKGTRCKRKTRLGNGYCFQHRR